MHWNGDGRCAVRNAKVYCAQTRKGPGDAQESAMWLKRIR